MDNHEEQPSPSVNRNDSPVTMTQLLEQQAKLESEVAEVLPFDISKCSRPLGPIRQSIYSCLTCNPIRDRITQVSNHPDDDSGTMTQSHIRAGICSSCSVSCHADHRLVELFVRRKFVCECGTRNCNPGRCNLSLMDRESEAVQTITTNRYDHNFDGQFCICERGKNYEPETEVEDMFQCLACEDWRHSGCLGKHPDADDWDDLICAKCVENDQSLRELLMKHVGRTEDGMITCCESNETTSSICQEGQNDDESKKSDIKDSKQKVDQNCFDKGASEKISNQSSTTNDQKFSTRKRPLDDDDENKPCDSKRKINPCEGFSSNMSDRCKAPYRDGDGPLRKVDPRFANVYLLAGWRDRWCKCSRCYENQKNNEWLMSEEEVWEPEVDQDSMKSLHELGIEAFKNLPHQQMLEGIYAYNCLRDEMMNFLKPFADSQTLVTEDEIKSFFTKYKNKL
ncbi:hypothetical protein BY996DRAFT_4573358 [Phakopsora pachyrhizi]|uniref:UBR-type domain-containing protein n=1 Tax=Phakopsora pachyrhizi TaxID=170000 RepID=A0AAV0ACT5_PHAPC|nr:hypothetical protein BY996DRAFT_4573358 [Phakopsora pachyrhizi]CAH7665819.1 hypothetical protein PPACK8108_LOCUS106 [Phakopsora pachyrhizi]